MKSNRVVIEIEGGNVVAVHASRPLEAILVDWDNIKEGETAGPVLVYPLSQMCEETSRHLTSISQS